MSSNCQVKGSSPVAMYRGPFAPCKWVPVDGQRFVHVGFGSSQPTFHELRSNDGMWTSPSNRRPVDGETGMLLQFRFILLVSFLVFFFLLFLFLLLIAVKQEPPIEVNVDNAGTIYVSKNESTSNKTKHIDTHYLSAFTADPRLAREIWSCLISLEPLLDV